MAELTIRLGDQVLQTRDVDGELLRVGRSRENDLVLDNLSVSRNHLQIRFHQGHYVLFDMNSSNGTYLNGARITRRELLDGDQITVGKHVLIWHDISEQSTVLENAEGDGVRPPGGAVRRRGTDERPGAWLQVESGRLKGREFKIVRFETTIGKAAINDIVLTDDWLLSKRQAIILRKGNDEFEIQDLGGIRKVKVNGQPVEGKHELKNGDMLELGGTKLLFNCTTDKGASRRARLLAKMPAVGESVNESDPHLDDKGFAVLPQLGDKPDTDENNLAAVGPNDSLDLNELFEHEGNGQSNHNGASRWTPDSKINGSSASGQSVDDDSLEAGISQVVTARSPGPALRSIPKMEKNANEKEIEMWESALQSPSPAIRRQAVRMLKQLTGRDYGA